MQIFEYDESVTPEDNFCNWYNMNCTERKDWNEKPYTLKEAKVAFESMYTNVSIKTF